MAYTGVVTRLPIGLKGFSGSRNPTQLQVEHLQVVEGLALDGSLMQKHGGASKLNTAALGAPSIVRSGTSWSPIANAWRDYVFLSNGNIRKDSGTGTFPTSMESGLNDASSPAPHFVAAGGEAVAATRKLFLFSSTNQVRVALADGVTTAAISTPPADWAGAGNFPIFGVLHEGRLWGGGNASDPHRIYYSTPTDHQNFTGTGSGTLSIFPGRGERLIGGISFKGALVLFKYPRGVYIVQTNDPAPSGWRVEKLSDAVGAVSPHCIVPIDNDVLYMDTSGNIHMLSATNAFGGLQTSNMSQVADMGEFIRSEVDQSKLRGAVGVWYEAKQQAWFALPAVGSAVNNLTLIVDLSNPQVGVRFLMTMRDTPVSMWMRMDAIGVNIPVQGDNIGFIWLMDRVARNKDGIAYPLAVVTANTDFSFLDQKMATVNKSGDFLEIIFEPQGDWSLIVQGFWDDVPGPPIIFNMGAAGSPLGSFTLGTDILSSVSVRSARRRFPGSGRRLRLVITNVGLNENVAVSDFYISFRPSGEKNKP